MAVPDAPSEKTRNGAMMALRRHGAAGLTLAITAPLVGGGLLVWQAWVLADVLGRAIEGDAPLDALWPSVLLIAVLLIARALLGAIGERAGASAAEAIKLFLRQALFAEMLGRLPGAAQRPASGAAAAAIIDQTEALDGFFARYLPAMVQASLLPLAFGAVVLPVDWFAGLLFLVTAPLIPIFMALAGWGAQLATDRQANALSRLNGRFADRLRGLLTLKLFGRAEAETADIAAASDQLRRRTLRVLRIAFLSSAVLEFFAALGVAGIALYVGLDHIGYLHLRAEPLTLSAGLFLLLMAPEIYNPLRLLAAHYHDRAAAKAAIGEIERLLGPLPTEVARLSNAAETRTGPLALRLDRLTLRTPDGSRAILEAASLDIAPGEHIAVVGPSGVGKTTLLETIGRLRLSEPGVILNNQSLADWQEPQLRAGIAMLSQKPRIFHGSIADNIALGSPTASRAEIIRAAELAMAADFAHALPHGYDTLLGEGGLGLSGGQAQRVALARLYLRNPGLVLLDEPTAHLDAELELAVIERLKRFCAGRTLIIATHSAAVAAQMDRALRMADGALLPTPFAGHTRGKRA